MRKKHLIILAVLITVKIGADLLFKVHYSIEDVYHVNHLKISQNLTIDKGIMVVGHNVKGKIEASIFPDQTSEHKKNPENRMDYIYIRFGPDFFDREIAKHLETIPEEHDVQLFDLAKKNHRTHFRRFAHINNYPVLKKGRAPMYLMKYETGKMITKSN